MTIIFSGFQIQIWSEQGSGQVWLIWRPDHDCVTFYTFPIQIRIFSSSHNRNELELNSSLVDSTSSLMNLNQDDLVVVSSGWSWSVTIALYLNEFYLRHCCVDADRKLTLSWWGPDTSSGRIFIERKVNDNRWNRDYSRYSKSLRKRREKRYNTEVTQRVIKTSEYDSSN